MVDQKTQTDRDWANEALKRTRTYAEFLTLYQRACDAGLGLHSKRGGYEAINFLRVARSQRGIIAKHPDWDRVDYLYNDGISTGESYIRNLHRHLHFR